MRKLDPNDLGFWRGYLSGGILASIIIYFLIKWGYLQ